MKYFFKNICSCILSDLSFIKTPPKFCINCKFYINSVTGYKEDGQCSLFPRDDDIKFLVSGYEDIDYFHCIIARKSDNMCGKKGKKYEKKPSENADI